MLFNLQQYKYNVFYWILILRVRRFYIVKFILDVFQCYIDNVCMCQFIEKYVIVYMYIKVVFERYYRNFQIFVLYVYLYVEIIICIILI